MQVHAKLLWLFLLPGFVGLPGRVSSSLCTDIGTHSTRSFYDGRYYVVSSSKVSFWNAIGTCFNMGLSWVKPVTKEDVYGVGYADDSHVWADIYNPNGMDCDSAATCQGLLTNYVPSGQYVTYESIDATAWDGIKLDDLAKTGCLKFKYKMSDNKKELKGEKCDGSKNVACKSSDTCTEEYLSSLGMEIGQGYGGGNEIARNNKEYPEDCKSECDQNSDCVYMQWKQDHTDANFKQCRLYSAPSGTAITGPTPNAKLISYMDSGQCGLSPAAIENSETSMPAGSRSANGMTIT